VSPTRVLIPARAFFSTPADPYAGGDLERASRLGAVLWLLATVAAWALLPLSQPDAAIGAAGWYVAIAITVGGLAAAARLASGRVSWRWLLLTSYFGVTQIALLDWLAGASQTPYKQLYLIIALYAGAAHPPRRLLGVLACIAAASFAPLLAVGASAEVLGAAGLQFVLLSGLGLISSGLMATVRTQRVLLRDRGDHAERLARIDDLTGLPNRRAFEEALAVETSRAERSGAPLCLILGDLDGFKAINDTHGHPAGDACLRAVAAALTGVLRRHDTCYRWGGDEFGLLLPNTTLADAEALGERLRAAVAERTTPAGTPLRITTAAALFRRGTRADELLDAADAGLFAAKRQAARSLSPA
jgi:diguanylate cyclase (GGDEF)-like protein